MQPTLEERLIELREVYQRMLGKPDPLPLVHEADWPDLYTNFALDDQDALGDVRPFIKLFTPDAGAKWLIAAAPPDQTELLYGLCDLGQGFPEAGYVSLDELMALRGPLGLHVERDLWFDPSKTLREYAADAREHQRIQA